MCRSFNRAQTIVPGIMPSKCHIPKKAKERYAPVRHG